MELKLYDRPDIRAQLLPLTYTRPVSALRVGIDTLAQKWQRFTGAAITFETGVDYLDAIYATAGDNDDTIRVVSHIIADNGLAQAVLALKPGERLLDKNGEEIARRGSQPASCVAYEGEYKALHNLYDIFLLNGACIEDDFEALCSGRRSVPVSASNTIIGDPSKIFIEEGADVEGAFINTRGGAVYIGSDATVMEGSMLRGPLALCEHSQVNMGAKLYGDTTIGPHCKVGGELNNVVMIGYSNKGHDGFLGNAVIGEWCNLGADTNNSNLKNDYSTVKVWSYAADSFVQTDEQFCGLFMGDHSKTAINTMFNTGTVVGVSANVAAAGFPRQFIPSFTWAGKPYPIDKALETARQMYGRRHKTLTAADEAILRFVYEATHHNRNKK